MGPKLKIIKPNVIRRRRPKIHTKCCAQKAKQYNRGSGDSSQKKWSKCAQVCTGGGSRTQDTTISNARPTTITTENKIKEINTQKLTVNAII